MSSTITSLAMQLISWWQREITAIIQQRPWRSTVPLGADGIPKKNRRGKRCTVLLGDEDVVIERFELPSVAYWRLSKLVQFKVSTDWPLNGIEPNFDWRIDHGASSWTKFVVEIAMADSEHVGRSVEAARDAGFVPMSVDVQRREDKSLQRTGKPCGLNLLRYPNAESPQVPRLEAVVCLALLAVTFGSIWVSISAAREREAAALKVQREAVSQAQPVLEAQRVLTEKSNWIDQATAEFRAFGSATESIESVADVLPDDAFLTSLEWREGEVNLKGEAKSASQVLTEFDREPGFASVQLTAPVVRLASKSRDRFQLRLSLAGTGVATQ